MTDTRPPNGLFATDAPPMAGLKPQEDYVDGPSSPALLGTTLEYRYTMGNHYKLSFDNDYRVTFEMLNHDDGPPPPLLPYRAREIRADVILVHWIVKAPGIHVSLIIDLEQRKVHAAAMMPPNRWEFFDTADILTIEHARD